MASSFNSDLELTFEEIEKQLLVEYGGKIVGTDSNDAVYQSITEVWEKEVKAESSLPLSKKSRSGKKGKSEIIQQEAGCKWYRKAYEFWEGGLEVTYSRLFNELLSCAT